MLHCAIKLEKYFLFFLELGLAPLSQPAAHESGQNFWGPLSQTWAAVLQAGLGYACLHSATQAWIASQWWEHEREGRGQAGGLGSPSRRALIIPAVVTGHKFFC